MDSNVYQKQTQIKKQKQLLADDTSGISLTKLFEADEFQTVIASCREYRERIFTPLVTLFLFIRQVLNPDKSCKKTLSNFLAEQSSKDNTMLLSTNTGPYCKARQRLPEKTVHELVKCSSRMLTRQASSKWKAYGREIKAIDGTCVKMADTLENQERFPQHSSQKAGCGFPIARVLVILSLSVANIVDYAVDAYKGKGTGEQSLLKRIFNSINKDDIVLGDRYFPSYFLLCDLKHVGADGLFRGQAQRQYDFRTGEKLGKNDHIVKWKKPAKPAWMSQSEYELYPSTLAIREFKVDGNVYVSTFLNAKKYHKRELAKLYKLRWHIEISLNSIKTVMKMDMLSCKTPDMVLKEIGVHFLAYNIIRTIIAEACQKNQAIPYNISFKGTVQLLNSYMPQFINSTPLANQRLYSHLLTLITKNRVGNRPGRVEPRKVKQRRKPFKLLDKPRSLEKNRIKNKMEKKLKKYAAA